MEAWKDLFETTATSTTAAAAAAEAAAATETLLQPKSARDG